MSHHAHAPALGRRRLTAALVSVPLLPVLTGCDDDVVDLPGLPPLGADPDEPLLVAALAAERATLDAVRRTVARHRALRRVLATTGDVHAAHVALLEEAGGEPTAGAEDPGDTSGSRAGRVAGNPGAALTALAERERALARQHVQRAVDARSGPFARLVAVLAAAATQQSVLLAQAAADLPRGRR